ncbi:alkylhydroperoxidase AhpD family core domain-containing protein [Verrucomicrobium sp. GAS474]|uniref:carboxymuconolactone decarboxylase family protein n=1 Tax=Verrucomicrobium sp. GAS474 TaxID=1882831 RepID=UPI00087B46A5|nr:carboxymuconolactone decarboxylase family protein [Verrucomicrobium sp. GAS474]SDT91714.1 alkylhydroperoxidase AhpD family core domain-containing protein [Verrucomicrobium sp. GAS474]
MKYESHAAPRLNYKNAAPEGVQALGGLSGYAAKNVPAKLRALVELRVSQINGCAYCINLHAEEARAAGEAQQRLDVLSIWNETTFFSDSERAALAWAEEVTLLGENAASDELYEEMLEHFSEKELVDLTLVIVAMNAWNRLSITFRNRVPLRKAKPQAPETTPPAPQN